MGEGGGGVGGGRGVGGRRLPRASTLATGLLTASLADGSLTRRHVPYGKEIVVLC